MQNISDTGEFDLIARIESMLPNKLPPEILLGPGDDAAAIQFGRDTVQLLTTDMQVENRHFRLEWIRPYTLGKRVVTVNLSDIAAMGGTPTYALVSLCLPNHLSIEFFEQMIKGMRDQMATHNAYIIGGNLSGGSDILIVNVTMVGTAEPDRIITRSNAKPGDKVLVTGFPGAGFGGYKVLEKFGLLYPDNFASLVESYIKPVARIAVGQELAKSGIATSMIDISDGFSSDLMHIVKMSKVGAEIYQALLPVHPALTEISKLGATSAQEMALHGGDSYELLFTVPENFSEDDIQLLSEKVGVKVTEIGRILDEAEGVWLVGDNGDREALVGKGWDHFKG